MYRIKLNQISLEVVRGDITDQPDTDAIVNAANAQLRTGGGVAGAIHKIGDPELTEETRDLAPISPGQAVITSAPNFPNKHIIHCLGPVYGKDKPEDKILKKCYVNALSLADANEVESIAFPAISTGVFGYPVKKAAETALTSIMNSAGSLKNVRRIRMVLWGEDDYETHKTVLVRLDKSSGN